MQLGTYSIDSRLAKGGMGEVWLGTHIVLSSTVAIKVMTDLTALSEDFQAQFRREVESTARLHHPNIVTVFDFGLLPEAAVSLELVRDSPFFVMEYVPGGSLTARRSELTWPELRLMLDDVLSALAHAHARGVIHRDIKPDNILMGSYPDGEPRTVLTDFGIAYAIERNTTTYGSDITTRSNEDMSGTPLYMAPEQFRGEFRDYGPGTDLYAIGVVAWEFATGMPPFTGVNPYSLGRAHMTQALPEFKPQIMVPEGFEKWVRRLLEKAQNQRYRTAADARWALMALEDPEECCTTSELDALPSEAELQDMPTMFMPVVLPEGSTEAPPPQREWRDVDLRSTSGNMEAGLGLFGLRTIPFIGREDERTELWRAFVQVNDFHKPRAIIIRGLAGTGKSRLAEWLFQTTQESGAAVGYRATHQAEPGAMHGLPWMLTERFRCAGLRPADTHSRVYRVLKEYGHVDEQEARALANIMRVERADRDPEEGRKTTQVSLTVEQRVDFIRREIVRTAGDRVAVVWLDDAIWDRESIQLVQTVLNQETDPILFVLTVREEALAEDVRAREALESIENHPRLSTINLEFFDDETFERLVRDGLMLTGPAASLVSSQCDGSPLYATQLVEFWLSRGALIAENGQIELVDETVIPPLDIANLWQSRLDHLVAELSQAKSLTTNQFSAVSDPDAVWKRLEMAAALGRDVDTDEWNHASELASIAVSLRLVDALVEARLAERTAIGFSFVHGLLRDALIKHAHQQRRWKRLNLTCARMLTSRYAQEHPGLAFRVARHFVEAKNATFAQIALDEAFNRESHAAEPARVVEVCRLMRNALERTETPLNHPSWLRLWTSEGRALVTSARLHEVERGEELLRNAFEAATKLGPGVELARVYGALGFAASLRNDHEDATLFSSEALQQKLDDTSRAEALLDAADIHNADRHPDKAKRHASDAWPLATRPDLKLRTHLALAESARLLSNFAEAEFEVETAQAQLEKDPFPAFDARVRLLYGSICDDDNRHEEALENFSEAWSLLKDSDTVWTLQAEELFARALLHHGKTDEARALLNDLARRLHVGERGVEVHPWDADLWASAVEKDWRAFEVVLQKAFDFGPLKPALRHFRALATTCQLLEDARETQRMRRVARHTLEVIERCGVGESWTGLFAARLQ